MEKFEINQDIPVVYVQANSFPMGVTAAFKTLEAALLEKKPRQLYGISHPDAGGTIHYRAAAKEDYPGEGGQKGLETFVIRKGTYISVYLTDWKKEESGMREAFKKLLSHPDIDPKGYCLELYDGDKNVRCLVPLKESTG